MTDQDPIVAEIRNIRKDNASKHGNDIHEIIADARKRQHQSDHKVISPVAVK